MQRRLLLSAAVAALGAPMALTGCATQHLADYAGEKPVLDLAQYFNGVIDAQGIFQDRSGKIVKRFTVVMDCQWTGNQGVLDEAFTYSDGSTQRRVWRLTRHANGRYTGTADDVVGEALGQTSGNVFRWNYTLSLPVNGKTSDAGPTQGASAPSGGSEAREAASVGARMVEVQFDDWMYLMNERVMLNRATMRKFGVRLGEVTLSFTKHQQA